MAKCEWCGTTKITRRVYKCDICGRMYCMACSKPTKDFDIEKGGFTTLKYCIDCSNIWDIASPKLRRLRTKQDIEMEQLKAKYYKMALGKAGKLDDLYIID
jgi:hypothetical protein